MARQARRSWGVAAVLLTLSLTACEGRATSTPTVGPTSTPPPTSSHASTTPPIEPAAQPAVDAYLAFNDAYFRLLADPGSQELATQLSAHGVDPVLSETNAALAQQRIQGIVYRGTPGTSRVAVTAIELTAKPWPTVTLTDCGTPGKLVPYYAKTNQPVKTTARPGAAPPPHLETATVIKYGGRWAVYKTSVDEAHTCRS